MTWRQVRQEGKWDTWWNYAPIPEEESNFYRFISDMAGWEAPTGHFAIIMACLVMYSKLKRVVEIGVWKGGTAVLLAHATKIVGGSYIGVDVTVQEGVRERLERFGLGSVASFLEGRSDQVPYDEAPIDLLFIDGDHSKEGTWADWNRWTKWVRPGGWIFIDNTTSERGTSEFFAELQAEESFQKGFRFVNCPASFGVAMIQRKDGPVV